MITAKDFSSVGAKPASSKAKPGAAPAATAGELISALAPTTDDTAEIARLHECLSRNEEFNQALLATVADPIFEVRKDGLILALHVPKDNEFGLSAEVVVGRRVMELLTTHTGQLVMHYLEKAFRTGATQTFSCQYLLPGKLRYFETRVAVRGGGTALAVVRDVTDRETLEKEVVESSNRVQTRIGQDIHDGLGQHLTGITFLSRALERNLAAKKLPEAAEAAEISKLVIEALAQTRNLARGLFPVEVESTRLCQSLRELGNTAEQ